MAYVECELLAGDQVHRRVDDSAVRMNPESTLAVIHFHDAVTDLAVVILVLIVGHHLHLMQLDLRLVELPTN